MDSREEYSRVLKNPDHVILSEDLRDLLEQDEEELVVDDSSHPSDLEPTLIFDKSEYMLKVEKISRLSENVFKFEGLSTDFPLSDFISGQKFDLKMFGFYFELDKTQPVQYRSNGNLTFTAQRIIKNEEVSI